LAKPTTFSGDGSTALRWLQKLSHFLSAQLPPLSDRQRIEVLTAYLEGDALDWAETLSEADRGLSWEGFSAKFLKRFLPAGEKQRLLREVTNMKWKTTETLADYGRRFDSAVCRANKLVGHACMDQENLVRIYRDGLPPLVRAAFHDKHFATYQAAILAVESYASSLHTDSEVAGPGQINQIAALLGVAAAPAAAATIAVLAPTSADAAIHAMETRREGCFHCGGLDHIKTSCPNLPCHACNVPGHTLGRCPFVSAVSARARAGEDIYTLLGPHNARGTVMAPPTHQSHRGADRFQPYARQHEAPTYSRAPRPHPPYQPTFRPTYPAFPNSIPLNEASKRQREHAYPDMRYNETKRINVMGGSREVSIEDTAVVTEALETIVDALNASPGEVGTLPNSNIPLPAFDAMMGAIHAMASRPNVISDAEAAAGNDEGRT
jgi:hypothetical protein